MIVSWKSGSKSEEEKKINGKNSSTVYLNSFKVWLECEHFFFLCCCHSTLIFFSCKAAQLIYLWQKKKQIDNNNWFKRLVKEKKNTVEIIQKKRSNFYWETFDGRAIQFSMMLLDLEQRKNKYQNMSATAIKKKRKKCW